MKISLIIPVYNAENYLNMCLDSCLNQDLEINEYEIIVIDDGSTDDSLDIAKEYESKYSNIRVFSHSNQGLSCTRNYGISMAQAEYLWFIDSDDWIRPNCLKYLMELIYNNNLDVLKFCLTEVERFFIPSSFDYSNVSLYKSKGEDFFASNNFEVTATTSIYSRIFLLANNIFFYEGIYHEDSEWTPKIFCRAGKVGFLKNILYFARKNPSSITRTVRAKKSYDLVVVVRESLKFEHKSDLRKLVVHKYNYLNATHLNSALRNIAMCSIDEIDTFYYYLKTNKKVVFISYWKSKSFHHKMQFIAFKMFPFYFYFHLNLYLYKLIKCRS